MINRVIKVNKKLTNNILSGLLLGSSMAINMQVQASQRHSRGSNFPPPRREIQENREHEQGTIGLIKEAWAKMTPKEKEEFKKTNAKRREKAKREAKRQYNKDFQGWISKQVDRSWTVLYFITRPTLH
jgi:hypothetical protein